MAQKQIKPLSVDQLIQAVKDEGTQTPKAVIGRLKWVGKHETKEGRYGDYFDQEVTLESSTGETLKGWSKSPLDLSPYKGEIVVISIPDYETKNAPIEVVEKGKYINLNLTKFIEVFTAEDHENINEESDCEWHFDFSDLKAAKGSAKKSAPAREERQSASRSGGSSSNQATRSTGETSQSSTRVTLTQIATKYTEALALAKAGFESVGLPVSKETVPAIQAAAASIFIAFNNLPGVTNFSLDEEVEDEVEEEEEIEEPEEEVEEEEVEEDEEEDEEEEEEEEEPPVRSRRRTPPQPAKPAPAKKPAARTSSKSSTKSAPKSSSKRR